MSKYTERTRFLTYGERITVGCEKTRLDYGVGLELDMSILFILLNILDK